MAEAAGYHLRRLQKMKTGSYIVSLPPGWVRRKGLKPHDLLVVVEGEGHLVVRPAAEAARARTAVIRLDEVDPDTAIYMLQTYYMQGAERVEIYSSRIVDAEFKRRVKEAVGELMGAEIYDMSGLSVVIRVEDELQWMNRGRFMDHVERLFRFAGTLLEDLRRAIAEGDLALMEEMAERSRDAQRRYRYIIRLISRMSQYAERNVFPTARELIVYATVARDLARLVHHVYTAVGHLRRLGGLRGEAAEVAAAMADVALDMFRTAAEYHAGGQLAAIGRVRRGMKALRELEGRAMAASREAEYLYLVRELRRIGGYCVALMDDISQLHLVPP